jgi:hypothetical protein
MGEAMLTASPPHRGYSVLDLQRCAEREVRLRRQVYPNRVLTHRMSPRRAESELAKMEAIAKMGTGRTALARSCVCQVCWSTQFRSTDGGRFE